MSEGDWDKDWFVIATDDLGDPIFVDTSDYDLPVYTAEHGEGEWNPVLLAISLENFYLILNRIHKLSINREDPILLNSNPIPDGKYARLLRLIKNDNPEVDIEWWESFLINDVDEDDN